MTREELNKLKDKITKNKDKAVDLDTIINKIKNSVIFSQLIKLLPDEVLDILDKYNDAN